MSFSGRKKRKEEEVDLTSLIDVVFLLLIFFMVSSTMTGQADVKVPLAENFKGVDPRASVIVTLVNPERPGDEPKMILGDGIGEKVDIDVGQVTNYIEQGLGQGMLQVIIKAERKVPHRAVMQVAKVVGGIEGGKLFVGVQQER